MVIRLRISLGRLGAPLMEAYRSVSRVRVRVRLKPPDKPHRPSWEAMVGLSLRWLNPLSALACVLALWRLCYDLNWAGWFAISDGFFSHWQVWLATAIVLQVLQTMLERHGRGGGTETP